MPGLQRSSMNWISMFVFLIVYFHFRFLYESDMLISCSIGTMEKIALLEIEFCWRQMFEIVIIEKPSLVSCGIP